MHCRIDGEPHTGPHSSLLTSTSSLICCLELHIRRFLTADYSPTTRKEKPTYNGCTPGPRYQDALPRRFPILPMGLSPRAGLHHQAALRRDATGTIYRAALRGCATRPLYEGR